MTSKSLRSRTRCCSRVPFVTIVAALLGSAAAQSVPCEKYRLSNGMTVILHADHSLPVVAVNTWFRVGSKDEPPGRSGFAHLFEHLMFMGTARVPGNDFDVIMETGGGANNASTTEDRTNYFSHGPAELLPTLLWLDADRLEDLGRTMDQAKLDRQREVVRNEIRQQVENTPYGRAEEAVFRLAFPPGHPYHDAVYGSHADLEAATVGDVKDFFATFYLPDNASLVVAGDFDPATVRPLIESLFGTLPRGVEPTRPLVPAARFDRVVRATQLDRVQLPLVKMIWHAPPRYADGTAELDLCADVLASGTDSRLYRRLVMEERLAVDVSAYVDGLALGSLFEIDTYATPGADLDRVERVVDDEIARLRADGATAEELEPRVASRELGWLASLQDVARVADLLNQYEFFFGEPDSFARDLERYRTATPDAVRRWARQVLDPDRRAILRVLPEDPPRGATPRDTRPADLPATRFAPPLPEELKLQNGIPVWFWRRPELPLVAVRMQVGTGAPLTDPATAGLAALTAEMLEQGGGELDAVAFAAAMQALGARFGASADTEAATAWLTVLKRNFAPAIDRMADAIRRPRLAAPDFERVHHSVLEGLRQADDEPTVVASRVAMRALFGADDPYGWPARGTPETVEPLGLDAVRGEHRALFRPERAVLFVAGDVSAEEARAALDRAFGDWRVDEPLRVIAPARAARDRPAQPSLRVAIVDRPDAVQTVIHLVAPGPIYRDPSRMALQALNTILGGSFTSRLNQNLRERHGYTYGVGSSFSMGPWRGWFTAGASVQSEVTGAALKELLGELARLRVGGGGDVTAAEVGKARQTLRTEIVRSFASLNGVLGSAAELELSDLPFDTVARDLAALDDVTAAELNALARDAIALDRGVLVLVGDRDTILAQIAELGLPAPEELDVRGRPAAR